MADVKTHTVTVVSDGLSYRAPGQEKPSVGNTWIFLPANRGDDIDVETVDYERFMALGAVVDADTREAAAAKAEPMRWGDPANAVRISGEDSNQPVDKLRQEAIRLGVAKAEEFDGLAGGDGGASGGGDELQPVQGDLPEGFDVTDEKAVKRLNVAQLKKAAEVNGVNIETADTKPKLQAALIKHAKTAAKKS